MTTVILKNLGKPIKNDQFFPPPRQVVENLMLPYILVGDETFKLSTDLMKPYLRNNSSVNREKSLFNYRLSRARRVSENASAHMSQVFRIFHTQIDVNPQVTDCLLITAYCFHNMLRDTFPEISIKCFFTSTDSEILPTENFSNLVPRSGFGNIEGFAVRGIYNDFFDLANEAVKQNRST